MDKLRALSVYARSLRRHLQGSGELVDTNHIFYEAEREIKKNGWENEAYELFKEELDIVANNLAHVIKEYYNCVERGELNTDKDLYFNREFHKLGVDGIKEETIKYIAIHKEAPSLEVLNEILEKRKEENQENLKVFFENQTKISNGEDFNKEELLNASKKLQEKGLYTMALRVLPIAISCLSLEELVKGYNSGFRPKLF